MYREEPADGEPYLQILSKPTDDGSNFGLWILEGDVIQTDPAFVANNPDAIVYLHGTQEAADSAADTEKDRSIKDGWALHTG